MADRAGQKGAVALIKLRCATHPGKILGRQAPKVAADAPLAQQIHRECKVDAHVHGLVPPAVARGEHLGTLAAVVVKIGAHGKRRLLQNDPASKIRRQQPRQRVLPHPQHLQRVHRIADEMSVVVAQHIAKIRPHSAAGAALKAARGVAAADLGQKALLAQIIAVKILARQIAEHIGVVVQLHPAQIVRSDQPRDLLGQIVHDLRLREVKDDGVGLQEPVRVLLIHPRIGAGALRLHPEAEVHPLRADIVGKFVHPPLEGVLGALVPVADLIFPVKALSEPSGVHYKRPAARRFCGLHLTLQAIGLQNVKIEKPGVVRQLRQRFMRILPQQPPLERFAAVFDRAAEAAQDELRQRQRFARPDDQPQRRV